MNPHLFRILFPFWIGIAFNVLMTLFNLIRMSLGLEGWFIDWYRDDGSMWIMGTVWGVLLLWSAMNWWTTRKRIDESRT